MGEERLDLLLREPVERSALGYDVPYEFVVPLARGLVRGTVRVREECLYAPFLDLVEPGELGPVVAQVAFERVGVVGPEQLPKRFEPP